MLFTYYCHWTLQIAWLVSTYFTKWGGVALWIALPHVSACAPPPMSDDCCLKRGMDGLKCFCANGWIFEGEGCGG
jgi:hypothetical protein